MAHGIRTVVVASSGAIAQDRLVIGGAVGTTRVQSPHLAGSRAGTPIVRPPRVGYVGRYGLGLDSRVSCFQASTSAKSARADAFTIGVRAAVQEASVTYRRAFSPRGRLASAANLGVARVGLTDFWDSDTPRQERQARALGVIAAIDADRRVARSVSITGRFGVRHFANDARRPAQAFELRSATLETGCDSGCSVNGDGRSMLALPRYDPFHLTSC